MYEVNELVREAHQTAVDHGWWETVPDFGTQLALCHCELSEALQAYRDGAGITGAFRKDGKPEGIPVELADCVIRIMDICGHYGIDLESAILDKMEYNKTRAYRHGGKVI